LTPLNRLLPIIIKIPNLMSSPKNKHLFSCPATLYAEVIKSIRACCKNATIK
jgi:hypothetical protein